MVDLKQFISAIDQIAEEKGISKEKVVETIEMALAAAYKKDYGEKGQNVKVKLEEKTGQAKFFQVFLVVDENMILSEEEVAALEKQRLEGEAAEPALPVEPGKGGQASRAEELEEEAEEELKDKKFRFNPKRHIMVEAAEKIKAGAVTGEEILIPLETKEDYGGVAGPHPPPNFT